MKRQNTTTRSMSDVDPYSQQMRTDIYDAARAAAGLGGYSAPTGTSGGSGLNLGLASRGFGGMGWSPLRALRRAQSAGDTPAAVPNPADPNWSPPGAGIYGTAVDAGQQGLLALSGDADATARLMNPYQQQVIDQIMAQFGHANALTSRGIQDSATRQGAFGGSRHGVAEGVALSENARNANSQVAGLLYGGFDNAMTRAGQAAGLGLSSAEQARMLSDPNLYRMSVLQRGMQGVPFGQVGTNTTPNSRNALSGALGGAISGYGAFGPVGGIIGGIGGLFG